jgi:hypothetical protein
MRPEPPDSTDRLVHALCNAINARGLYPAAHPLSREPLLALAAAVASRLAATAASAVTLLMVDGELVLDGEPRRGPNLYRDSLVRALGRAGVERLTLKAGATAEELAAVTAGLCHRGPLAATEHVVLGRIARLPAAGAGSGSGEVGAEAGGEGLDESHLDSLEAGLEAFEHDDHRGWRALDEAVWRLLEGTAQMGRSFVLLAGMRRESEALYRHSVSVCLHALALARVLGIDGPTLHDLAAGALLHDVGWLTLLKGGVRESGVTSEAERAARRRHPELGALRLAAVAGMPELPILVAYEHHVGWDGCSGYPHLSWRPNLGAQVTAVADTWDTLLSLPGPAPRAARRRLAAGELRRQAGTRLNPRLVDAFLRLAGPGDPESASAT